MGPAVKFVSTTRGLIYEKQRLKQILGKTPSGGGSEGEVWQKAKMKQTFLFGTLS